MEEFSGTIFNHLRLNSEDLYNRIESMPMQSQIEIYSFLGKTFNKHVWTESNQHVPSDIDIPKLMEITKTDKLNDADLRIKAFLEGLTHKTQKYNFYKGDNANDLANCWDSILKARNKKYVSLAGLKEHIVCYISSNKNKFVTEILRNTCAKGNRNLVEKILDLSQLTLEFKNPEKISLFISFDNIQKLFKSYRLSEEEQERVYGVIVTSILAILPDGLKIDTIQYKASNNLTYWYSEFRYDSEQGRDHTGIKIQVLMSYYAKLNGHIKIQVCGLVYAKT